MILNSLESMLNKAVTIDVSGEKKLRGILIDIGQDIMVIYNGENFIYIPTLHIQNIKTNDDLEEEIITPTSMPYEDESKLSYRKILQHARGQFVELYVSGRISLHGYVTAIMNNYFVFYSPIHKTVYIHMYHLKWLIPYSTNQTPFSLERERLPVSPYVLPLSRTFEEQLQKLVGEIVIFDLGDNENKIGLLNNIDNQFLELTSGKGVNLLLNLHHIKTVHSPKQL